VYSIIIIMEAALDILRRNDPEIDDVNICLALGENDIALANALEEAVHIRKVYIYFCGHGVRNVSEWRELRRVLSSLPHLQIASLTDDPVPALRRPAADARPFMEAISANNAIRTVIFQCMRVPCADTVALLNKMTRLDSFSLSRCQIEPQAAAAIADALQNIKVLCIQPTDADVLPIVQRQQALNRNLPTIALDMTRLADNINDDDNDEDTDDEDSDDDDDEEEDAEANNDEDTTDACLQAVARCQNLQLLQICNVNSASSFRAVLRVLPTLRMRIVKIDFGLDFAVQNRTPRLLQALIQNYNLHRALCFMEDEDGDETQIFARGTDEHGQLQSCLSRNLELARWIADPSRAPPHLWSKAIVLAQAAGKESLWKSLLRVAPTFAARQRKRKRKRPQYYKPS